MHEDGAFPKLTVHVDSANESDYNLNQENTSAAQSEDNKLEDESAEEDVEKVRKKNSCKGCIAIQETHLNPTQVAEIQHSIFGNHMVIYDSIDLDWPNVAGIWTRTLQMSIQFRLGTW